MHFEVLSTKYVNFNHFRQFFENFVTKFLFFWQFFSSFLVWETIIPSKALFRLEVLHLSYAQRGIKKFKFQTSRLQIDLKLASQTCTSRILANDLQHHHQLEVFVLEFFSKCPKKPGYNVRIKPLDYPAINPCNKTSWSRTQVHMKAQLTAIFIRKNEQHSITSCHKTQLLQKVKRTNQMCHEAHPFLPIIIFVQLMKLCKRCLEKLEEFVIQK